MLFVAANAAFNVTWNIWMTRDRIRTDKTHRKMEKAQDRKRQKWHANKKQRIHKETKKNAYLKEGA